MEHFKKEKTDAGEDRTLKMDLFWNAAGSLTCAAVSAVLAFAVMRIAGAEDGGIFGFGFSTFGQQMFILAYFGIRPFHITDAAGQYSFGDYRSARIRTVFLAAAVSFLWPAALFLAGEYPAEKAGVLFLLALYKVADGWADVYESECQRSGFLWRGGRELCFRTLSAAAVLLLVLRLSGSLAAAAGTALLVQAGAVLLFRHRLAFRAETAGKQQVRKLLGETLLLFFSVFLDFYVFSGVKYAIDLKLDDTASGVFNILFMPTSVIYLAANFIIRPFLTRMAALLESGDEAGFAGMKRKLLLLVLGLAAAACLGTLLLGKPVLRFFELLLGSAYTGALTGYAGAFVLIILGGGLYAAANLYYYILVTRRMQKQIFLVYLAGGLLTALVSPAVVEAAGITGASALYAALMAFLVFGLCLCEILHRRNTGHRMTPFSARRL